MAKAQYERDEIISAMRKIDGTYMVPSPSFRMEGQTARCLYSLQLQREP